MCSSTDWSTTSSPATSTTTQWQKGSSVLRHVHLLPASLRGWRGSGRSSCGLSAPDISGPYRASGRRTYHESVRELVSTVVVVVAACSSRPAPPRAEPPLVASAPRVWSSPGPLAASHEAIESDCYACHPGETGEIAPAKCLDCHEHADVRARITAGKGFHATAVVRGKPCTSCHDDHRGRSFDLRGWEHVRGGEVGFDHELTGWPLEGAHAGMACARCHSTRNRQGLATYVGVDRACVKCHAAKQPHGLDPRRRAAACELCHGTTAWKPASDSARFDHDDRALTRFALGPAHAKVECAKCHTGGIFDPPGDPPGCEGCHAKSPHARHLFGTRACAWCHTVSSTTWKRIDFDHAERTKLDLGAHRTEIREGRMRCVDCHTAALGAKTPQPACQRCHQAKSPHRRRFERFANKCETCHPTTRWSPRAFDHRVTGFALTARHAQLTCRACHRGSGPADFERLGPAGDCIGCHAHANIHALRYSNAQCLGCHTYP